MFATRPVVEDDNVLWVEDDVISGAFTWGTILRLDYALEQLVPQVAEIAAD